jgi:hypothetical protein
MSPIDARRSTGAATLAHRIAQTLGRGATSILDNAPIAGVLARDLYTPRPVTPARADPTRDAGAYRWTDPCIYLG